jgi:hypothetical protein
VAQHSAAKHLREQWGEALVVTVSDGCCSTHVRVSPGRRPVGTQARSDSIASARVPRRLRPEKKKKRKEKEKEKKIPHLDVLVVIAVRIR